MRKKRFLKISAIIAGIFVTILLALWAIASIYKKELVSYINDRINTTLLTPLSIGETSVTIFEDFPAISLKLKNVQLHDTLNNLPFEVINAKQLILSFEVMNLLKGKISIKRASIKDASFNHFIDKFGKKHTIRFKPSTNNKKSETELSISNLIFTNVNIYVTNLYKEKELRLHITKGKSSINFSEDIGKITPEITGELLFFKVNNIDLLKDEPITANGLIEITNSGKIIQLKNCVAKLAGLDLVLNGKIVKIDDNDGGLHNMTIKGKGKGVLFLKALLPKGFKNDDFKSGTGSTELNISIAGRVSPILKPAGTLKLNIKNGSFKSLERQSEFKNINFDLFIDNSDSTINKISINTSLKANFEVIDVQNLPKAYFNFWDKIVSINASKKNSTQKVIPAQNEIFANVNLKIGKVSYLNAVANNVSTEVNLSKGIIHINNFKGEAFNGTINFNATFQDLDNNTWCNIAGNLNQVDIPKAFFGFNNFGQKFIKAKHLKGKFTQDFKIKTELDAKNIPIIEKTSFIGKTILSKSELIEWEPLMKAFEYIGKDKVANLLIDKSEIDIVLFNNTVYFLPFEVNSSFTKFNIVGKQSLKKSNELYFQLNLADQLMITSKKKKANFKAGIETDRNWGNVFVKLTGTDGNYKPEMLKKETYLIQVKEATREFYTAKKKVENLEN